MNEPKSNGEDLEGDARDQSPPADLDWRIRALHSYWESLRVGNATPRYAAFDPIAIPKLLPHIWLLDVVRDGDAERLRFRLVGSILTEAGAEARVGYFVDELHPPKQVATTLDFFRPAIDSGLPVWRRGTPKLSHNRFVTGLEMIGVPFINVGPEVDLICNLTVYYWRY